MRQATAFHPFTGCDLPWLVDRQAAQRPDKSFLIWESHAGPRQTLTYAQFAEETRAYAAGLAAKGVKKGDFIALHMDNCPEFLLLWYALSRIGAVTVTTNTRSTSEELQYFIAHSGAKAAITQPRYAALLQAAGPRLDWIACTATDCDAAPVAPLPSGLVAFDDLRGDPVLSSARAAEPMLANSVQYTSGTTSRPKGVVWTHANALWGGRVTASHARLTDADVHLVHFPLFHTNAICYSVLATLWSGGTVVLTPKFSAGRFWDIAARNRCTWANVVMFTLRALEAQPDPPRHWFRFWAGVGDLALPRDRWGIKTNGWFGMTETVSQCIVTDPDMIAPEGSMGWPAQEYEIAIRREDGTEVSFGETGRLWIRGVRGVSLFESYLNDAAATAAAFDADGWFDTGDEVRPTAEGPIFFVSRAKDMLRVGAENVAAVEIETVIARVPGVVEVAVVGKPDRMLDEIPVAFVVATAAGPVLASLIHATCDEALADFKRPREIIFVEALPKGLLDKTLKKELRARLSG
ncbi:MAG: AMP-binding protein [Sphingopyxis sp.]|nr:AMP-binding protein [Sphingopyxis sp.]